jgi:sterol desaturase/sphingolipid hydroxylase (fatty acid hydroxylase superfamily)
MDLHILYPSIGIAFGIWTFIANIQLFLSLRKHKTETNKIKEHYLLAHFFILQYVVIVTASIVLVAGFGLDQALDLINNTVLTIYNQEVSVRAIVYFIIFFFNLIYYYGFHIIEVGSKTES